MLALALGACNQDRSEAKARAKAQISLRAEGDPTQIAAAETLSLQSLESDRRLLDRVWTMPWREVRLRLDKHQVWRGRAKIGYGKVGGAKLALEEEAELLFQRGTESLDLSVSNDGGFFQRVVFSNGMLYKKYQNGDYLASRDLEAKRLQYADEAFALGATGWDLFGRLMTVERKGSEEVAGRMCRCFSLRKAVAPAAYESASLQGMLKDLKAWRAGLTLDSLEGSICIDQATAVPMKVQLKARALRPLQDGQGELLCEVSAGFASLTEAPEIKAPESYLDSLRRPRRARPGTEVFQAGGIETLGAADAGQTEVDRRSRGRAVGKQDEDGQ